jgi:ribose transport system permease protein
MSSALSDHEPSELEASAMHASVTAESGFDRNQPGLSRYRRFIALSRKYQMVWILVLVLVGSEIDYHSFFSLSNIENLLSQNAALGIVALGSTFVILSGGFDLSVGGIFGFGAVIYASGEGHISVLLAILLALIAGAVLGVLNGGIVTAAKVNPFIATIGTGYAITGIAMLYSSSIYYLHSNAYTDLGSEQWFGLDIQVWLFAFVALVAAVVLARTVYGRSIYAVGGNLEAARLSGLPTSLLRGSVYVVSGVLAALGGVVSAAQSGSAQADIGSTIALVAITVVIIGGTALSGGEGAIWRTVVGLLIIASINDIFAVQAVNPAVQSLATGGILVIAVALDKVGRAPR